MRLWGNDDTQVNVCVCVCVCVRGEAVKEVCQLKCHKNPAEFPGEGRPGSVIRRLGGAPSSKRDECVSVQDVCIHTHLFQCIYTHICSSARRSPKRRLFFQTSDWNKGLYRGRQMTCQLFGLSID